MKSTEIKMDTDSILRRCKACDGINRILLPLTLQARCGHCGHGLLLSHYDILGVTETVSADQIKLAYRQKLLYWHPDKRPGDRRASQHVQRIREAYRVLYSPEDRAHYNHTALDDIHIPLVPVLGHSEQQSSQVYATADEMPSEARQSTPETVPSSATHSDDEPIAITNRTLTEFALTTGFMLAGLATWAMVRYSTSESSDFLLWVSLVTGIAGLARLVVSLLSLGTRDGI